MSRKRTDWGLIITLTKKGLTRLQVAEIIGCNVKTVHNVLRKEGLLNQVKVAGGKRGYRRYCSGV